MPSEAEVAGLCGVGRSAAREGLKLLEQEGLVVAEQGRGRFLAPAAGLAVPRPVTRYESVTTMLAALGIRATCVVLSVTETGADPAEAAGLGLAEGEPVIRLERLRVAGEDPLVFSVEAVPRSVLAGPIRHLDFSGSLNRLLAARGRPAESSAASLRAVELPDGPAQRYSLAGLGPWLLISETAVTADGQRVLYAQDYHRGAAFSFNVLRR